MAQKIYFSDTYPEGEEWDKILETFAPEELKRRDTFAVTGDKTLKRSNENGPPKKKITLRV